MRSKNAQSSPINLTIFLISRTSWFLLKVVPLWLDQFLISSGLLHLLTNLWSGIFKKTTLEIVEGLTKNKDLQTVFFYC